MPDLLHITSLDTAIPHWIRTFSSLMAQSLIWKIFAHHISRTVIRLLHDAGRLLSSHIAMIVFCNTFFKIFVFESPSPQLTLPL